MEDLSIEGSWWLPGSDGEALQGSLTIGSDGLVLVVHGGSLHRFVPSNAQGNEAECAVWTREPVVHGRRRHDGRDVSLLGVTGLSPDTALPVSESDYRAELALVGCLVDGNAFDGAEAEFDYLNAWLEPPAMFETDGEDVTVHIAAFDMASAEVLGGDHVRLVAGSSRYLKLSRSGDVMSAERCSRLVVDCGSPTTWEEILNERLHSFHDLLVLSLDRPVRMTRLRLRPAGVGTGPRRMCDAYADMLQPAPEERLRPVVGVNAPTLLRAPDMDPSLLLGKWFPFWETHRGSLTLLLAPAFAPFMFSEHRFLLTFASAEVLAGRLCQGRQLPESEHAARVAAVVDAAEKAGVASEIVGWAQKVLQSRNDKPHNQLITELVGVGEIGERVKEAAPGFVSFIVGARGGRAHGSTSGESEVNRLYWHGEVLRWIVRARLLSELGITDAERRALEREPFRYAVEQISVAAAT